MKTLDCRVTIKNLYSDVIDYVLNNLIMSNEVINKIDTYLYFYIFEHLIPVDRKKGFVKDTGMKKILKLIR